MTISGFHNSTSPPTPGLIRLQPASLEKAKISASCVSLTSCPDVTGKLLFSC